MSMLHFVFPILTITLTATVLTTEAAAPSRVIGYWTNWSGWTIPSQQLSKLTHIVYSFAATGYSPALDSYYIGFTSDNEVNSFAQFTDCMPVPAGSTCSGSTIALAPYIGAKSCPTKDCQSPIASKTCSTQFNAPNGICGGFAYMAKTVRAQAPNVQVLISIGGAGQSDHFPKAASAQYVDGFVKAIVEFVVYFQFDGVDIDWEIPMAGDTDNYTKFIQKLQAAFAAKGNNRFGEAYTISAAVIPQLNLLANIDLNPVCSSLTFISIMTYDMQLSRFGNTGHHSPIVYDIPSNIVGPQYASVDLDVNMLLNAGCSPAKINIGTGWYSHTWQKVDLTGNNGLFQSADVTTSTAFGDSFKTLSQNPNIKYFFDNCAMASYAINPTTNMYYSLDTAKGIDAKLWYLNYKNLGGFILWELSMDDDAMTLMNAMTATDATTDYKAAAAGCAVQLLAAGAPVPNSPDTPTTTGTAGGTTSPGATTSKGGSGTVTPTNTNSKPNSASNIGVTFIWIMLLGLIALRCVF